MASTTKAINNPTYLGSMIAGQQYQANQGLPNEYDVDAELFGNVKKQFGGDGKPRGIDALISGLATGAEYGSKMKGIGLRKEELAKYNKVMDYFMAANMEAEKANKKNMEMEEKRQALMPYGLAGMELSYSGMPYDAVNDKMRNLFEQAQLNDPNIKGKYIGFIPNSPLLNVRDENGKDSVFSLAKIVGEDGVKRIQGDWVERQKLDAQQQGLQLQERGLGIQQKNANINQDYLNLEKQKREEEQKNKPPLTSEQIKYFTEQSDKLKGIEEEATAYKELEKLLVKTDEKGNPILDKKGNKQLSNEALGEWFTSRPNALKNAKQVRFDQLQSDLTGAHFKKMGYRNETEYKKIRNVDSQYGAKENMKIIEDNLRILEKGLNKKKEIDSLLERSLSPLTQQNAQYGGQQPTQTGNNGQEGSGGGTITLYDPKSQATKTIPTSDYAKSKELAKKQGFGVIE